MKRFLITGTFSDFDIPKKSELGKKVADRLYANVYNGGTSKDWEKAISMASEYDLIIFFDANVQDISAYNWLSIPLKDLACKCLIESCLDGTFKMIWERSKPNQATEFGIDFFENIDDLIESLDKR